MLAHFNFIIANVMLHLLAQESRKTSVSSMHCAAVLATDHLLWSIYGSYFAAIDPSPEKSGWVAHNSDSPPRSMSTPCPGMKLTLACRLGAEISPNRCDKNLIPPAPMDRAVREQPWSHDVREVLLSPCCKQGKTCTESERSSPVHLPAHTLVWCIKIHELCWFECQGLWQRSPSA